MFFFKKICHLLFNLNKKNALVVEDTFNNLALA
jgi:hypothetical protein